jgi:transcriptional regulator with XRE-family HTH domain
MDRTKAQALRLFIGESMQEFGSRIGAAASTISEVENGNREVSDRIRAKLTKLELQMPADFYDFFERFKNNA